MAKTKEPEVMDLNLMRPAPRQRLAAAEARVAVEHPVATLAARAAYFGSHVLGFSGRAAHVLERLPGLPH